VNIPERTASKDGEEEEKSNRENNRQTLIPTIS